MFEVQSAVDIFDALGHKEPLPASMNSLTAAWHGFDAQIGPLVRILELWLEIDSLGNGNGVRDCPIQLFGYGVGPVVQPVIPANIRSTVVAQCSASCVSSWNSSGPSTIWGAGATNPIDTVYSARLLATTAEFAARTECPEALPFADPCNGQRWLRGAGLGAPAGWPQQSHSPFVAPQSGQLIQTIG